MCNIILLCILYISIQDILCLLFRCPPHTETFHWAGNRTRRGYYLDWRPTDWRTCVTGSQNRLGEKQLYLNVNIVKKSLHYVKGNALSYNTGYLGSIPDTDRCHICWGDHLKWKSTLIGFYPLYPQWPTEQP